ncbi:MAG: c-type cytochrome [Acidimicrobiia bacterium]
MARVIRWLIYVVVGLMGLVLLAGLAIFVLSELELRKTYDVEPSPVAVPTDADSIAFGEHLATTWAGCAACHGDHMEGDILFEDEAAKVVAPNLTAGEGGVGSFYRDEDWVLAIRHGIKPSGRSILIMPETLHSLSDEELGAIIAYLKNVPAVDNILPNTSIKPMGRLGTVMGLLNPTAALIDHEAPRPPAPAPPPSIEYGAHIANGVCVICHGTDFAGGTKPKGSQVEFPADEPIPRNLTPAGNLRTWTETDFVTALRTGITPAGDRLDDEAMPWPIFSELTDDELTALWRFISSLPPAQPAED